jgi:tetratricopeptide (TPR) repeat protein
MSRSTQPQTRRPLDDEDETTPRPPSWSDLDGPEGSFFAEGLSEEALAAASEREHEREALHRAASGRTSRPIYVVAAAGACLILGMGLLPKPHPISRPTPLSAAPAVDSVQPPVGRPASAPTIAMPGTVSLQGLRAAGPAATTVAPVDPVAAVDDPQASCDRLLARGKFVALAASCGRAFAAAPSAGLAVKVARSALERERYADAQTWAQKAISLDDHRGDAFLTLGGAEQGLGHAALARDAYARYLELEPQGDFADDVRALINEL